MGRIEGKRPVGGPRRRWVNNIKMDVQRSPVGRHGLDWIALVQDRESGRELVNVVT